jgi:hypothetical protein
MKNFDDAMKTGKVIEDKTGSAWTKSNISIMDGFWNGNESLMF